MQFILEIEIDNAAFDGRNSGSEVARIIREVATEIDDDALDLHDGFHATLRDINGNKVGAARTR